MTKEEFREILRDELKLAGVLCLNDEDKAVFMDMLKVGKYMKTCILIVFATSLLGILGFTLLKGG